MFQKTLPLRLIALLVRPFSARHFRRYPTLDTRAEAQADVSRRLARHLHAVARGELHVVLGQLDSTPEGLTAAEAAQRRARQPANEVAHDKPMPGWRHLWQCYRNPFNLLLTVLAAISWLTEDIKATVVIGAMVAISTLLRFVQERRSGNAAERLKAMVSNTATVLRRHSGKVEVNGPLTSFEDTLPFSRTERVEVPIRELVPGEVIQLSAGDMVPADLRLLHAKDLFVSQAALTGEALPVEKFAEGGDAGNGNPLELRNLCFMGTNVISGSARAVVIATGANTCFGALAERVTTGQRELTAFQLGVNSVSWVLIRFMFVMAPLVLFLNGITKGDWTEAALFALSIAVGLTPEMLPMIVTATLARGAVTLSRKKVIVKQLDAIQNLGAMQVLCTDKTGTLTQDRIVLERHVDVAGQSCGQVLKLAYLNSYYQTGLKNLLDVAVLEHLELNPDLERAHHYAKADEIPFDFNRRRMSVVVADSANGHQLICKGALDEVLGACRYVRHDGQTTELDDATLARIRTLAQSLNQDGLRVVAVATRTFETPKTAYGVADETELTLEGYIAFLDPPKESTAPALRALARSGVAVKVLTGDNTLVTRKVCREVGLAANAVLEGPEIDAMDDSALLQAVRRHSVFTRLTPMHKERIVRSLRGHGLVVGFLGDGINDAPALRAADVGISVDSAVDIAKEAADMILLEKSLMVLEDGVIEGRKTFANMLKYLRMTASSNFGNVFSVLVASAFLPFLPMLPIHLLVQNLLYDISQVAIPFDKVDRELMEKPQKWQPESLSRFMLFFGPISSVFDIATYSLMWFVFSANTVDHQTLFQSGWFIEGLLSQTLIVHMLRTRKIPFLQSRAAWPLLSMTVAIIVVGIALPMGPLAAYFKLQALPLSYFPWLVAILLAYMVMTQAMKGFYAKRYGWQ